MANAILDHFRQLINQDMERRLDLNQHLFKTHALMQLILKDLDCLTQIATPIKDCLYLLQELIQQASQNNDFALGELANHEHLFNESQPKLS